MATRARVRMAGATAACTFAALATQLLHASVSSSAMVAATSLRPTPDTATPLHNPGMGLAVTFDDDQIPSGLTAAQYADPDNGHSFWKEAGVTALLGSHWMSILYIRTTWANLQPTSQSTYAWNDPASAVSKLVTQAKKYNLKVAFQVVTDSKNRTAPGGQATPDWFFAADPSAAGNIEPTNFKDPIVSNRQFQAAYTAFIKAFGTQYDDPNLVSFVDGVGVGVGGDLLDLNQPAAAPSDPATLHNLWSTLTDAYKSAFPNVPLTLDYLQNGAFDVADLNKTLADPTHHYVLRTHGLGIPNPNALKAFNTQWPTVPVVAESAFSDFAPAGSNELWETYYTCRKTNPPETNEACPTKALLRVIIDATSYHTNILNLGLPAAVHEFMQGKKDSNNAPMGVPWAVNWWSQNGGYRIVPTSVTLPRNFIRGVPGTISSTWSNIGMGILPRTMGNCQGSSCVKYRISYALLDPNTHKPVYTTLSSADPGTLTGSTTQQPSDAIRIPASVHTGPYDLAAAIVDQTNGNAPAVQLGLSASSNPEYDSNGTKITPGGFTVGWYQLGSIRVL